MDIYIYTLSGIVIQTTNCLLPVDSPSPGMQQSSQVRSIIARDQGASIQTFPPATYGFVSRSPLILDPIFCTYGGAQPKSSNPDSPPAAFGTTWIDTRSSWGHLRRRSMDWRTRTHGTMWHSAGWSLGRTFAMFFWCPSSWLAFLACHPLLPQLLRPCSADLTRSCSGFHLLRDLMATTTVCSLLVCPWIACPNPRRLLHFIFKKNVTLILFARLYNLYIPYHQKYISENGYTDIPPHTRFGSETLPLPWNLPARCRTLGRSISSCSQLGNFSEEFLIFFVAIMKNM